MTTDTKTSTAAVPNAGFPWRRELAWAAAILAVATLAGFFRLTLHPTDLLVGIQRDGENDVTSVFLAFRDLPRLLVARYGGLPFWNPHSMAGTPCWGNPQSALFYPPNWLFYFMEARVAISWLMVAHHWWAAIGTYLLCRRYGCAFGPSLVGGILFLLTPYYVAHLGEGHYNQVCVVAWLPWGLLGYERFRERPATQFYGIVAVLVLGLFAGHVQELFYLVLTLCAFLTADIVTAWRGGRRDDAKQLFVTWCFAGLMTAGLGAIELNAVWGYTQQSSRGEGMSTVDAGQGLRLSNLSELLDPMALGGPTNLDRLFYWESVCHFGVLPLLLAIFAVVCSWRTYPILRIALAWLLALNFAFGHVNLLFMFAHRFVPGVGLFRGPARILFLCALAVAILAAFGLHELCKRLNQTTVDRSWRMGVGCGALLTILATGISAMQSSHHVAGIPTLTWMCLSLGATGLALVSFVEPVKRQAWVLVGLACFVELTLHAGAILRTIPQTSIRIDSALIDKLQERSSLSRIMAPQDAISDLEAWTHGLYKPQAYEPVPLKRYVYSLGAFDTRGAAYAPKSILGFEHVPLSRIHRPLADLLGIRYAVVKPHGPDKRNGWTELWRESIPNQFTLRDGQNRTLALAVYENPTVLPRAFIVGRVRTVANGENILQTLEKLDPHQEVILEKDWHKEGERAEFAPAEIVEYSANRMTIRAKLEKPGYLVVADTWYSGWRATVNGERAKILPANVGYRAIPLQAGEHVVEMKFTPPGFISGFVISFLSALALLYKWRHDQRAGSQPAFAPIRTSPS